jgi:CheY-like chemotaxis protein
MTNHPKHQLMLIDDNEIDQLLHRKIIELIDPSISMKLFADARSALNYMQSVNPDELANTIMLLDIQMPVMTGFQFLEVFDTLTDDIKNKFTIYILSSSVNQFDISKAKNNPYVKDMIIKPLTKDTLLNLLR